MRISYDFLQFTQKQRKSVMDLSREERWGVAKKALLSAFSTAIVAFPVFVACDAFTNAQPTGNDNTASETTIDWKTDINKTVFLTFGVAAGGTSIGTQVLRDERKKIAAAQKPEAPKIA
jgi:hypothetical protein